MQDITHHHLQLAVIIALLAVCLTLIFKGIDSDLLRVTIYAMAGAAGITLFRNPPANNGKPPS